MHPSAPPAASNAAILNRIGPPSSSIRGSSPPGAADERGTQSSFLLGPSAASQPQAYPNSPTTSPPSTSTTTAYLSTSGSTAFPDTAAGQSNFPQVGPSNSSSAIGSGWAPSASDQTFLLDDFGTPSSVGTARFETVARQTPSTATFNFLSDDFAADSPPLPGYSTKARDSLERHQHEGRATTAAVPSASAASASARAEASQAPITLSRSGSQQRNSEDNQTLYGLPLKTDPLVGVARDLSEPISNTARAVQQQQTSRVPQPRGATNDPYTARLDLEPSAIPRTQAADAPRAHTRVRSNSNGAIATNSQGLYRWSNSSASSPTSTNQDQERPDSQGRSHQRQLSSPRSRSIDSIGFAHRRDGSAAGPLAAAGFEPSPRRKLSKRRPSVSGNSTRSTRSRRPSSPPPPSLPLPALPPPSLPPIVTLPSLDIDSATKLSARVNNPVLLRTTPTLETPSSVFSSQFNGEPQDYFWDAISSSGNTPATGDRGNLPTLQPAPFVLPDNMPEVRGPPRPRSSAAKANGDMSKAKDRSKPSQKAMLSKALAKANTAVQLDNAQNYEGARASYTEACDLLQLVLSRTTGDEDKKKLEAIRRTYTSRIEELDGLVPNQPRPQTPMTSKALPARPGSGAVETSPSNASTVNRSPASRLNPTVSITEDGRLSESPAIPRVRRGSSPLSQLGPPPSMRQTDSRQPPPPPFEITRPRNGSGSSPSRGPPPPEQLPLQSSFSRSPMRKNFEGSLQLPQPGQYFIPAPLSPRKPVSPAYAPTLEPPQPPPMQQQQQQQSFVMPNRSSSLEPTKKSHARNPSHESISWLDPIDESAGSAASSVHSRTSSLGFRRKHIRAASGDTEAEFDAALDAAVEAAYDEGYEPMDPDEIQDALRTTYENHDEDMVADAMRRVELAKERVRQTEREAAIELAKERDRQRQKREDEQQQERPNGPSAFANGGGFYDGEDSDEDEERMLEEMTRGYVIDDFAFGAPRRQSNARSTASNSLPRESDSSGHTNRTWHSSVGSSPPTATTLSTVAEMPPPKPAPSALPPPPQALPALPQLSRPGSGNGVRSRRLSGQNPKQLKIETSKITAGQPPSMPPPAIPSQPNHQSKLSGSFLAQQRQAINAQPPRTAQPAFNLPVPPSPSRAAPPAPLTPPQPMLLDDSRSNSPNFEKKAPVLRKNQSTSSLKSLANRRQYSVSNLRNDEESDFSPETPLTTTSSNTLTLVGTNGAAPSTRPTTAASSSATAVPGLPTPMLASFRDRSTGGFGGLSLFDSDFHSPAPQTAHAPLPSPDEGKPMPLEPCPNEASLRPFWLMRALYQTLVHPRGGYLSNKLFVPQDVWKVKGVKLRNVEDKCGQMDLLTAALARLKRVDENDADAVLEEMQAFENVLESVQTVLTKKLGNEVGLQGLAALTPSADSPDTPGGDRVPRSSSVSKPSSGFRWGRLRNKGSSANMAAYGGKSSSGGSGGTAEKDLMTTAVAAGSIPIVAHPTSRSAKRDISLAQFDGPFAAYMGCAARLFDAAQVVDQIARQVEDPGLRHADKTQVGLELCTRHAAEFFGFYICRFVLSDLGMLLDKFVKRGTEWVLN